MARYFSSKSEAVAIIIDVSPPMNVALPGEDTPLKKCITAANMIVQRKIFSDTKKNKDEVVLILFGTEETQNDLHAECGEGYEHVTVVKDLSVMDLDILKYINQEIEPGPKNGDFIDALIVAMDHLHKKCLGRKVDQKIVLFSTLCCDFNGDAINSVVIGIKSNNVHLIFAGPEIEDEDDNEDENGFKQGENENSGEQSRASRQNNRSKPLTDQQVRGSKCMGYILKHVNGQGITISEILPMLSFFEMRRKRLVTTFRGPIEIGSTLKINTYAYVKVKEEKNPPWKKLSALAEHAANRSTMEVEVDRSFYLNDEDQTVVESEHTAKAYRYGKTLVPMTDDDQKAMKLQTTRGCLVLGFTSRDNVALHMHARETCHIFTSQPGDEHAAVAFSALCHALEEKNMVAIVRYVTRANADPKIGFLAPHIKSSYDSLIFIALPYREDIRSYMFPSLEGGRNTAPTDEQLSAVDSLIDSMFLIEEFLDEDDGKAEEELFKPSDLLNPVNQRVCQCIQSRALNPEESRIPEIEEYIARSIRVKPEMAEACSPNYNRMKKCFPLKEVEKKKESEFEKEEDEPAAKQPKLDDDISLSLTRQQVTEVGLVDPLEDFKTLLEAAKDREKTNQVMKELSNVVMKLVKESFLNQHYPKALDCTRALRKQCMKLKQAKEYNDMLATLKDETYGKRRQDFWDLLCDGNFNPISQEDANDSSFTKKESNSYFTPVVEEKAKVDEKPKQEEDEEDLLDML